MKFDARKPANSLATRNLPRVPPIDSKTYFHNTSVVKYIKNHHHLLTSLSMCKMNKTINTFSFARPACFCTVFAINAPLLSAISITVSLQNVYISIHYQSATEFGRSCLLSHVKIQMRAIAVLYCRE